MKANDPWKNLVQEEEEEGKGGGRGGRGLPSELLCISDEQKDRIFMVKMMLTTHETTAVSKFINQDW